MSTSNFLNLLCSAGQVIPAPRTPEDFKYAITKTDSASIILLFGDIIMLPDLLAQAQAYRKRLLVHLDLLEGIGKDEAGIRFLARLGVTGLITTKSHLCKIGREEGMLVIQRLFLLDSDALKTGLHLLHKFQPDALEVLPASIPASVVRLLAEETQLPILAGGLMHTPEDVQQSLQNGIYAVSASKRELWNTVYTLQK